MPSEATIQNEIIETQAILSSLRLPSLVNNQNSHDINKIEYFNPSTYKQQPLEDEVQTLHVKENEDNNNDLIISEKNNNNHRHSFNQLNDSSNFIVEQNKDTVKCISSSTSSFSNKHHSIRNSSLSFTIPNTNDVILQKKKHIGEIQIQKKKLLSTDNNNNDMHFLPLEEEEQHQELYMQCDTKKKNFNFLLHENKFIIKNQNTIFEEIEREAVIDVRNIDCAIAELALRKTLKQLRGVLGFWIDILRTTSLHIRYDLSAINAMGINKALKAAGFYLTGCSLNSLRNTTASGEEITQLTLAIPEPYRTSNGWTMIQNHALSRDGVRACVISTDGQSMYLSYDSITCGARSLLSYINSSGIECYIERQEHSETGSKHNLKKITERIPGGWNLLIFLTLALLWASLTPPKALEGCMMYGLSGVVLFQAILAFVSCVTIGSFSMEAGLSRCSQLQIPCAHLIVSVASLFLLFISCVNAAILSFTSSNITDSYCFECTKLIPFDIVSWIFIIWCSGLELTHYLRSIVSRDLDKQQHYIDSIKTVRLIEENNNNDTFSTRNISRELTQRNDGLLVKAGERVGFDGIAKSSAVIQEPPLVSCVADMRPFEKQPGSKVYAGSLVMSSELTMTVTSVADTKLKHALTLIQQRSTSFEITPLLRSALYFNTISGLIGITCAIYYSFSLASFREDGLILANSMTMSLIPLRLLYGVTTGISIWLSTLTGAISSAGCAVLRSAAGRLGTLGIALLNNTALEKASRIKHIVISRSSLPAKLAFHHLIVCNGACIALIQRLEKTFNTDSLWNTQNKEEDNSSRYVDEIHLPSTVTMIDDDNNYVENTGLENENIPGVKLYQCVEILWQIIGSLECELKNENSRVGTFLYEHAPKLWTLTNFKRQKIQFFPGKGVEGIWSLMMETKQLDVPCAVGSLEFIIACHHYGFQEADAIYKSQWEKLEQISNQYIQDGYDVAIIAAFGIPLGGVVWQADYGTYIKPALEYIQNSLHVTPWLVTGKSILGSRNISKTTGISSQHIISGLSTTDKLKFLSHLLSQTQETIGIMAATTSSEFLSLISSNLIEYRNKLLSLCTDDSLDIKDLYTVASSAFEHGENDISFRAVGTVGIINLLLVSKRAQQLKKITAYFSILGLALNLFLFSVIFPNITMLKSSAIWALLIAMIIEWFILLISQFVSYISPAMIIRKSLNVSLPSNSMGQDSHHHVSLTRKPPLVNSISSVAGQLVLPKHSFCGDYNIIIFGFCSSFYDSIKYICTAMKYVITAAKRIAAVPFLLKEKHYHHRNSDLEQFPLHLNNDDDYY